MKTMPPKLEIFVLVLIWMKGDFSKTENFRKYGPIRQLYRKLRILTIITHSAGNATQKYKSNWESENTPNLHYHQNIEFDYVNIVSRIKQMRQQRSVSLSIRPAIWNPLWYIIKETGEYKEKINTQRGQFPKQQILVIVCLMLSRWTSWNNCSCCLYMCSCCYYNI